MTYDKIIDDVENRMISTSFDPDTYSVAWFMKHMLGLTEQNISDIFKLGIQEKTIDELEDAYVHVRMKI